MSSEDVFHVKRGRSVTLVLLLAMLSLGAIACAAGESARGWAAPVPNGDIVVISTGKGAPGRDQRRDAAGAVALPEQLGHLLSWRRQTEGHLRDAGLLTVG